MSKAATLGDLHLGRSLHGYDLTPHTRRIMYQFARRSIGRVDYAVQLGDVFDSPRPATGLEKIVVQWCNEFERSKTPLYLMTGNHDVISKPGHVSALDPIKAIPYRYVHVIDRPTVIRFGGHTGLFLPFPSTGTYETPEAWEKGVLDALKRAEFASLAQVVVYTHLDIAGASWGDQDLVFRAGEFAVPLVVLESSRVRVLIGGHVHKPQRRGRVWILGAAQRLRIDESGMDRFLLQHTDGRKIRRLELPAVTMLDVSINAAIDSELDVSCDIEAQDQQQLLDAFPWAAADQAIVRISAWTNARTVIDWGVLERRLYDAGAIFVYPIVPRIIVETPSVEGTADIRDPEQAAHEFIFERIPKKSERKALLEAFQRLQSMVGD